MGNFSFSNWSVDEQMMFDLVRRLCLSKSLVRRFLEEQILCLVDEYDQFLEGEVPSFRKLNGLESDDDLALFLSERQWTHEDLVMEAGRTQGLLRFAEDRFGSAIEDVFLRRKSELDQVIYSLLRVRDPGFARELWIQISEGEISFAQAASQFGEGQESRHAGLIGPVSLGDLYPIELRTSLQRLKIGAVDQPQRFGDWIVLLRLENLMPVVLDSQMRERLLMQELDTWLEQRSLALIEGRPVDPLDYHPSYDRNSDA